MWLTVLVLAVAISFEPARPAWVPLMLVRPRPVLQLAAFFAGNLLSGLIFGLLVLFVFHQSAAGDDKSTSVTIQIGIGVAMVLIALIMVAVRPKTRVPVALVTAHGEAVNGNAASAHINRSSLVDRFTARAQEFLRRGTSPWLSGAIGVGTGLPSVDYLAALLVIGSSGAPPVAQVGALVMFLVVGNAVVVIPLMTYLVAPEKTLGWIQGFQRWVQSRTRRQFAAVIAAAGLLQIVIGFARL